VGNRLTSSDTTGTWTYNDNNELNAHNDTSYEYDDKGNMTKKTIGGVVTNYIYNQEDRLVEVRDGSDSLISSYYYDPFGRRLWKEVGGVRTYFLYSDEGLIGEYDSWGSEIKTYGYAPGSTWTTDPLFMKDGGDYYFYQNDHLGTPQQMTSVNGGVVWLAKYSSFGDAEVDPSSNIINLLRFPGQYYDQETSLHYNYHRYYHSDIGRYMKVDPLTKGYDISRQEHTYSYTMNNPIAFIDPLGLMARCTFIYSSANFVSEMGYQGTLICKFDNESRDPKCCGTISAIAYTGKGDKRRFTSQEGGPIPTGMWHIANIGSQAHRPGQAWLLARKGVKKYPNRDYDDFLIHPWGSLGSYGCIAVIKKYGDFRYCLDNESNTGPERYTCGTLEVKIE
jgi:RHS repeat-associated protein